MDDMDPPFDDAHEAPSVLDARFDHPHKLAKALAESVAEDLRRAVDTRGVASLVVSGGTTPVTFFRALRAQAVPWSQVWITLADERWVAPDHEASNEALVCSELLAGDAASARFVPLKNDAATAADGVAACEQALDQIPRPFDVVVLGMGTDGHTASLFPDAPEIARGLDLSNPASCLAMHPPAATQARMSLTLRALLDSQRIVVHITGDEKWQVYRRALHPGPATELPIRAILDRGAEPIDVYWAP
jgi:6-phosphogluconolactonase